MLDDAEPVQALDLAAPEQRLKREVEVIGRFEGAGHRQGWAAASHAAASVFGGAHEIPAACAAKTPTNPSSADGTPSGTT